MNILDRLDELEREAMAGPWRSSDVHVYDAALIALSRNHLRALIDVARAAEAYNRPFPDDEDRAKLQAALAPLLAEEET